jgi:hypothetical protein
VSGTAFVPDGLRAAPRRADCAGARDRFSIEFVLFSWPLGQQPGGPSF